MEPTTQRSVFQQFIQPRMVRMKKNTTLSWKMFIIKKIASIFIMGVFSLFILFNIKSVPLRSVISLINRREIIFNYGMSIACFGGLPFALYIIGFTLRTLFQKRTITSERPTLAGSIFLFFSIAIFGIFIIASYLVPLWLIFSGYHPCQGASLHGYFVLDLDLCKSIVPPSSFW